MLTKRIGSNYFDRYRWFVALIFPLVLLLFLELGLSVVQIVRKGRDLKPYYVTPLLRPLVRIFIPDDFQPRVIITYEIPWDTKTDRLRPGHYKLENKRLKEYTINSYGIRGKEFAIPKPANVFRIIVFGGSSTFGAESTDEETFPAVLEKILQKRAKNKNIEVLNYGISSKSLYYLARHYFSEADQLQPDIVIFNSIRNTAYYDANPEIIDYNDIVDPSKLLFFKTHHFLSDHSLLFRFLKRVYKKVAFREWKKTGFNKQFFHSTYYDLIEGIYKDAKRRGIGLMFIFEPCYNGDKAQLFCKGLSEEQLYIEKEKGSKFGCGHWDMMYSMLYRKIEQLKAKYPDVMILDPIEAMIKAEDKYRREKIFFDDVHLMPAGNKVFAQLIAEDLLKNRVIPLRKK